jgi:hypothetical protein
VIDVKVALSHHLFQIPEAEPEPEIPTDTEDDDLGLEMSPFEQRRLVASHSSQSTRPAPIRIATLPDKAWARESEEPFDDFYSVELPQAAADFRFQWGSRKVYFVDYLREVFQWGGFPGWREHESRPVTLLAALSADLLPK